MKKILQVVLGGFGGAPVKEFGNRTPLEAALTPRMDKLAQTGKTGVVRAVTQEGGSVFFCMSFATIADDGKTIIDRRVGRDLTREEAAVLAREINRTVTLTHATFEFKTTMGHGGVLVIRAMHHGLSARVTPTDPTERSEPAVDLAKPMPGHEKSASAIEAAALLNEFTAKAHKVLQETPLNKKRVSEGKSPANIVLSRYAGDGLPEFLLMSEHDVDIVDVPSDTGHPDIGYATGAKTALQKMSSVDGLYIRIKGPEGHGHGGDPDKKSSIEAIDKHFFGNLLPYLKMQDVVLAVTVDHAAPCRIRAHGADPSPLLVCGGRIKPDGSMSFSEKACLEGSLGDIPGKDLWSLLIKLAKE